MVRYTDNFVVLCRNREEAQDALDVNRTLAGWFEYFKHSDWKTFEPIDGWVRRRLRSILWKREKRKGMSRGWDNMRWPNKFFRDYGLYILSEAHRTLLQSLAR